ncbi:class I SAM-dependent methyltransferase [Streptomyces monticola]|uniref:Class I SAM-dependent methyltransferase n=1 Tax=Streptomyces monticola TaxID=2666263 RepID=A0ABW2JAM4_9ACTN
MDNGTGAMDNGTGAMDSGTGAMDSGTGAMDSGTGAMDSTVAAMTDRTAAIAERRAAYRAELADGTGKFHEPRRTTCPWCGSGRLGRRLRTVDFVQEKPGRFTLDACRDCGHIFQNPRLNQAGLAFYYRDFYDGLGGESTAKMFQGGGSRKRFRASTRALLRFATPKRWLDIGTAHGHFCETAQLLVTEAEFDGLDMGESVELAEKEGRIAHAHRGLFTELAAAELAGNYDAVSMFHYLEHTLDPHAELAAAHTALRPGGHLLIEVPNPESPYGRLLGRFWVPWFQPQHLQLMPRRNLCRALEAAGFTVVAAEHRDAHIPVDLVCAAWFLVTRVLPKDDAPWLERRPGRARRLLRAALALVSLPLILLAYGADLALAPLVRRTRFSNAYRVIARRDPDGPRG